MAIYYSTVGPYDPAPTKFSDFPLPDEHAGAKILAEAIATIRYYTLAFNADDRCDVYLFESLDSGYRLRWSFRCRVASHPRYEATLLKITNEETTHGSED